MMFAVGVGVPLGFVAAKRDVRRPLDNGAWSARSSACRIPVFFLAQILKWSSP